MIQQMHGREANCVKPCLNFKTTTTQNEMKVNKNENLFSFYFHFFREFRHFRSN